MEQFMKLPPAQKAAVLAVLLAVIGGGFYFTLIEPEITAAEQARNNLSRTESQLQALQAQVSVKRVEMLRKRREELVERDKENRKMLPKAEEVPGFIKTVYRDATKTLGLRVVRFERLERKRRNLIDAIPVKMTVEGSYLKFLAFLRMYAGNERRVINLREIDGQVRQVKKNAVRKAMEEEDLLDDGDKTRQLTEEEKRAATIREEAVAREMAYFRVTFTAEAFIWTGETPPVDPKDKSRRKKTKKKRT
jgi:Tfp pilus assembly protein PilO